MGSGIFTGGIRLRKIVICASSLPVLILNQLSYIFPSVFLIYTIEYCSGVLYLPKSPNLAFRFFVNVLTAGLLTFRR